MFMCWISLYAGAHGLLRGHVRRDVPADAQAALVRLSTMMARVRFHRAVDLDEDKSRVGHGVDSRARLRLGIDEDFGRSLEGTGPVDDACIDDARAERLAVDQPFMRSTFFGSAAMSRTPVTPAARSSSPSQAPGDYACPTARAAGHGLRRRCVRQPSER